MALFVVITIADFIFGRLSDSFEYARRIVSQSTAIEHEIGRVQSVQLRWFWGFQYRTGYGNSTSILRLHVLGARQSLDLTLDLKQNDGQWAVAHASTPL